MKRSLVPAIVCAALLTGGGAAVAQPKAAPVAGTPVAAAAASEQAATSRGRLLTAKRLTGVAALPSAAANYVITYTSVGARGQRVVVSGIVSLPRGRAPHGGWPVMSWAHGTTGSADVCAPSRDTVGGPAHEYLSTMRPTVDRWLTHGFVVVQTDYEGLGTPGPHPYINGTSAANGVVDIVRAARSLDRRVGRDWVAVGHSQGGQATLFNAADAATASGRRADVRLRGAVSIAPGGTGISQTAPYIRSNLPGAQQSLGFLATILVGAEAADPAVDPEALLSDEGEVLLAEAATQCQPRLNQLGMTIDPTRVFDPAADLVPLTAYLTRQEPERLTVTRPTLVLQGTADTLISKASTDTLVTALRQRSDDVQYAVYAGADHRSVVATSFADQLAFARAVLRP